MRRRCARARLARGVGEVTLNPDAAVLEWLPPWQRVRYSSKEKAAMAMSLADARCFRVLFARGLLSVLRPGASALCRQRLELFLAVDPARRRYALVVNTAGPDLRLARAPSVLLRELRQAGLVSPVRVDPSTCSAIPADADAAAQTACS